MLNIIKVVFLGIILVTGVSFFTAKKPQPIEQLREAPNNSVLNNIKNLPESFEIVGKEGFVKKEEIFTNKKSLVILANQDSIGVVMRLREFYEIKLPFVIVANISSAPWFIKKWAIPEALNEINKKDEIVIFDNDGYMASSFRLNSKEPTEFFAYIVDTKGDISKIYKGSVKKDAMLGNMSEEEMRLSLAPLIKLLD